MMMIRDIRKAVKDYDFSEYFVDRNNNPAWEKWEKVLSEAGVKGITEILQARVLNERWRLRDACNSVEDFRWAIWAPDMRWTEIPNVFGHWTEDYNDVDEPHTRLHTWMDYKGWLKDEFSGEPSNKEDKELMYELGLVKDGWNRLTDNGIVSKTWESEDWFD